MPTLNIEKPADLSAVAAAILKHVEVTEKAAVVALHGELGAGKTTLVQYIAKTLKIEAEVTSPTFVIMKQYELLENNTDIDHLIHVDAYRIEDPHEMEVLHFDELLAQPRTLICIEWAENIAPLLPKNMIDVTLTMSDKDGGREIIIHGY